MTTTDVVAAAQRVAEAFERLGVRYYVGGSLASATRGVPRASIDVDMAAELRPEHVASLVAELQEQIRVGGAGLDQDFLARWAAALGMADLLERALADAGGA